WDPPRLEGAASDPKVAGGRTRGRRGAALFPRARVSPRVLASATAAARLALGRESGLPGGDRRDRDARGPAARPRHCGGPETARPAAPPAPADDQPRHEGHGPELGRG